MREPQDWPIVTDDKGRRYSFFDCVCFRYCEEECPYCSNLEGEDCPDARETS